ncbi:alanine racemase [Plebeiibacterium marinum]|uniref:Alanine racemase n=1 Tax=Plebeiibacterium marinum TaxID=2992111 RepID=A0AAE3ME90_9BACT|nr:alanine racemase [Plebeiobacterium marinum]MCW3805995.1 alanine racemase [Plebeiobacterium marinum]
MGIISEPTLLLNPDICRRNIRTMNNRIKKWGGVFRPHFKTHQSAVIGEWFKEEGVGCITVSSFKMAEYFARKGWEDITVAITATILNVDIINQLAAKINLNIVVEDGYTIQVLEEQLKYPVGVFIKADTGYHRTGMDADDLVEIKGLLNKLRDTRKLIFIGFLTHAGNTYEARGVDSIVKETELSLQKFLALKVFLKDSFPLMQLSWGDTPGCSVYDGFQGVDEFRPGNFVFYDYMQSEIGCCQLTDVAVCLAAPVIAVHPQRNEIVVHSGAVHLSKDRVTKGDGSCSYGKAVSLRGMEWDVESEIGEVKTLSQEHGIIKAHYDKIISLKPGDVIGILPVHSCLTANLMKKFLTTEGNLIQMMQ